MSTPAPPTIRSIYRRILRELPIRQPSASLQKKPHHRLSSPSAIQKRIRETITSPPANASANPTSQAQQAEQLIKYLQHQRMYVTLVERYNPGMGMSEEERVRLTARRVGMDLPVEFKNGGES